MSGGSTNVFVSYSHADASLIGPVVKLLRVNSSFVFQDVDQIRPGKKWRSEITSALKESQLVVVFWCDHARKSIEVENEWKEAIKHEKDLLPLLLDETPLPEELSEFQWIDFRDMVGANHGSAAQLHESPAPSRSGSAKSKWVFITGFTSLVIAGFGLGMLTVFNRQYTPPSESGPPINLPSNPAPEMESAYSGNLLLIVSFTIAIVACLFWFFWPRSKNKKIQVSDTSSAEVLQQQIATKLEAEMLRRTKN